MHPMIRRAFVLGCMALSFLAPRAASAITLDQVIVLTRSGVTDTVILALIDRDRTVFAIEPEQIVTLQREGISEKVMLAMLRSGRAEGEEAARADAAFNSAWIMSALVSQAESVSVGHGPDRPNTPHVDGFYSGPPSSGFALAPYYAPSSRRRAPSFSERRSTEPRFAEPRALCYAQISTARASNQTPFITVCPEVMQPRRQQR